MIATSNGVTTAPQPAASHQSPEELIDKIYAAAQPGAVFSAPVVSGSYTVITASEVMAGGGFGSGTQPVSKRKHAVEGEADASSGSGGGGFSRGRPIAAIVVGPDGVKVQPIVDATRVVVTVFAVIGGLLLASRVRNLRPRKG
jgi:uncharacterized spore protein YtfJ